MNFIDPLLAKNDESSNSILTEDMGSAQGGLPNQNAKNSLLNKEISKVALKFTIAGISNIKKYAKYTIVDCNYIIEAHIKSTTGKATGKKQLV